MGFSNSRAPGLEYTLGLCWGLLISVGTHIATFEINCRRDDGISQSAFLTAEVASDEATAISRIRCILNNRLDWTTGKTEKEARKF